MLNIILSAFLSFNIISTKLSNPFPLISNATSLTSNHIPQANISYGEYETNWWREGVIGRHQMISIDSSEYIGRQIISKLTDTYSSKALINFKFTESISTIITDTISTSEKLTSQITSTIGVKASLPYVEVSDKYTISNSYVIENTATYSYSKKVEYSISYEVNQSLINGRDFYLANSAYIYKIKCQKWQYDNYWWGNYEVKGSRSTFYSYLTLSPVITVGFIDGTFIE